jgi:hypothetical protein
MKKLNQSIGNSKLRMQESNLEGYTLNCDAYR